VRPLAEHDQVVYDLMIIATLDRSGGQLALLAQSGVPKEKLFPLRNDRTAHRQRV
jgi:hypothetical protein